MVIPQAGVNYGQVRWVQKIVKSLGVETNGHMTPGPG
jgi:hypothetical protein